MRLIIPSINRSSLEEATQDIRKAESFLPADGRIQIDVSDGRFSETKSWGDPEEFANLGVSLETEVHLMVEDPESVFVPWLQAGAKRLAVPVQAVRDIDFLKGEAEKHGADLMLSFDPSVPIESAIPYLKDLKYIHVLSVSPGPSGQSFDEQSLERIKFLREANGGVKIEVDGGINPEIGKRVLEAGADILVVASYIFQSENPAEAFKELESIL